MARRLVLSIGVILVIVAGEFACCLLLKIPAVPAESFSQAYHGLGSFLHWNIGYAAGHHGAVLARSTGAPSLVAAQPKSCEGLADTMQHELQSIPSKMFLESALYVALFGLAVGIVWWRPHSPWRRFAWYMYAPVLFVLLAGAPLVGWSCGSSMYSNYQGPCWSSVSGGWYTITLIPAETVSYRTFLEALAWLPIVAVVKTHLADVLPPMSAGLGFYVVVCSVYTALGAALCVVMCWVRHRVRRRRTMA
jgi:hypothetical protein